MNNIQRKLGSGAVKNGPIYLVRSFTNSAQRVINIDQRKKISLEYDMLKNDFLRTNKDIAEMKAIKRFFELRSVLIADDADANDLVLFDLMNRKAL